MNAIKSVSVAVLGGAIAASSLAQISVTGQTNSVNNARFGPTGYSFTNAFSLSTGFSNSDAYTTDLYGTYASASMGAVFKSLIVTQTSAYVEMDGFYNARNAATNVGQNLALGFAHGFGQLNFTTTSSALVSVSASNTVTSSSGTAGAYPQFSFLIIDGYTYQSSAVDGVYSVLVGAGSHSASYEGYSEADAGYYLGYGTSTTSNLAANYKITVQAVPEPATISVLALGVLAIRNRRRLV